MIISRRKTWESKIAFFICFASLAFSKELDVGKISEAIGHLIGKNLEELGVDFDLDAVVKGLKEESEGKASPLSDDECVQAILFHCGSQFNKPPGSLGVTGAVSPLSPGVR